MMCHEKDLMGKVVFLKIESANAGTMRGPNEGEGWLGGR